VHAITAINGSSVGVAKTSDSDAYGLLSPLPPPLPLPLPPPSNCLRSVSDAVPPPLPSSSNILLAVEVPMLLLLVVVVVVVVVLVLLLLLSSTLLCHKIMLVNTNTAAVLIATRIKGLPSPGV
jgi:hypothetical protein